MNFKQVFRLLLLTQFARVNSDRGTIHRNTDEEFQMLLAGGIIPDNGKFVSNIVSIRTLSYIEISGDNHFCTGIIISSRAVLTAAHCVADSHMAIMSPRSILIVFGLVYRLEYYSHEDTRRVLSIKLHPSYQRYVKYDVALLRLNKRIPGNLRHVKQTIKLSGKQLTEGMKCITLGWGQVYPHGPYANELMFLEVTVRSHDLCKDMYKYTPESNICVEPHAGGQVCPGDLGGPLMCDDHISGIIGGSLGCEGIKSMKFVNFSHIAKWVDNTVSEMSSGNFKRTYIYLYMSIAVFFFFKFPTNSVLLNA